MEVISIDERNELERCEIVIKQGLETFVEVGTALMTIRNKKLYRFSFSTFEDYCRDRWGMARRTAYQYLQASEVIENVRNCAQTLPQTESQARPLTSLEPEVQRAAWQEVVETHGENITAAKVQEVVDSWKPVNEQVHQAKEEPIFAPPVESIIEEAKANRPHVANNSGENEWYTPKEYIEAARRVMGSIDLDPASCPAANVVVKAAQIFTIDDDGLLQEWSGNVWMNPPYAQPYMAQFAEKVSAQFEKGNIHQAIVLVNNATETAWFQRMAGVSSAICFPKSRIKFWNPQKTTAAPLQGQAVLYLGSSPDRFTEEFSSFGLCVFTQNIFDDTI
jgi:hypothetical protein